MVSPFHQCALSQLYYEPIHGSLEERFLCDVAHVPCFRKKVISNNAAIYKVEGGVSLLLTSRSETAHVTININCNSCTFKEKRLEYERRTREQP